ncbi:MAG: hypothetical protein IT406_00570 [Candidatus Yanofskybacteria bacterium]|nr:hypothetical protein [Candidatus Yanofskybacteria bacterium]
MLKVIFAKDVRAGDSVLISGGARVEVEWVELCGADVTLKAPDGCRFHLKEYDIVGLGRRPWPEWKTERYMQATIVSAAENVAAIIRGHTIQDHLTDPGPAITALRGAIEEYELGRRNT